MPLKILALDTATEACSAALLYNNQITERYEFAPRKHSMLILSMLQAVLDEAGLTLAQLDALAFGRGPGSFTGVRIATSVVQGIAFAHDLPVVPISTLRALAQGAYRELEANHVLPAIDAQMDEVYWGAYKLNEDKIMVAIGDEYVCAPTEINVPRANDWVGIGSGWDTYHEILQKKVDVQFQQWVADRYPRARDIAILAAADYQEGKTVSAGEALPVYLRDNVVRACL